MRPLKFLSTFTGIGGLEWGLEKLEAECVGFSEIKASSAKAYRRHFPLRENFGDITKIEPDALPDFDVFLGGFPCQSFSLAGHRKGFTDRRGQMIFYIYDILLAKRPEFAVLENVKGILNHDGGKTYRNVFKLLSAAGYKVRVVLLNASHYGSPQARERALFLCRYGEDFPAKRPEIRDTTKRFRDVREVGGEYTYVSDKAMVRLLAGKHFDLLGGYDRVNSLTTSASSSGMARLVVQEPDGRFRYLTALEGERLQGFPDFWTEGLSNAERWFAIGNAVNCAMSEYLFLDYLKGVWWN